MANDILLGQVTDADGDVVEVWRNFDGTVSLISLREDAPALTFSPGGMGAVGELLGRAAMPGQTGTGPVAYRRACCDHCNNGEGDPAGHDYTLDGPHDGPCEKCAAEKAWREHDEGTG